MKTTDVAGGILLGKIMPYRSPISIPADITPLVERRTREQNISGYYRLWVRIPGWPTIVNNSFSDETLNRGPM